MKNKTVKEKLINNEKIYSTSLFIQTLLVSLIIISLICSLFIKNFIVITKILTSLTLIIMSYNNYKFFAKNSLALLYLGVGILILVFTFV